MSEGKTLKEIALELLEEYRAAEEAAIYECSGSVSKAFVNRAMTKLDYECGRFLRQIVEAAEPKTAVWVGEGDGYSDGIIVLDTWYCSNCDYCYDDDEPPGWNYCPNCGKKMEVNNYGKSRFVM